MPKTGLLEKRTGYKQHDKRENMSKVISTVSIFQCADLPRRRSETICYSQCIGTDAARSLSARGVMMCKRELCRVGKVREHTMKGPKSGSNKVVMCCWTQEKHRWSGRERYKDQRLNVG